MYQLLRRIFGGIERTHAPLSFKHMLSSHTLSLRVPSFSHTPAFPHMPAEMFTHTPSARVFFLLLSHTDLQRMYQLLRRIPSGIENMLSVFELYVSTKGRQEMLNLDEVVCVCVHNVRALRVPGNDL